MLKTDEKVIDGHHVSVTAWPFLKMMKRKRIIIQGITKSGGDLVSFFLKDDEQAPVDGEDLDIKGIVKGLESLLCSMTEQDMEQFIGWIFETVHIDGDDMSNASSRDLLLSGNSVLFYKVAYFVLEVTYGDFFGMVQTLIGNVLNGSLNEQMKKFNKK